MAANPLTKSIHQALEQGVSIPNLELKTLLNLIEVITVSKLSLGLTSEHFKLNILSLYSWETYYSKINGVPILYQRSSGRPELIGIPASNSLIELKTLLQAWFELGFYAYIGLKDEDTLNLKKEWHKSSLIGDNFGYDIEEVLLYRTSQASKQAKKVDRRLSKLYKVETLSIDEIDEPLRLRLAEIYDIWLKTRGGDSLYEDRGAEPLLTHGHKGIPNSKVILHRNIETGLVDAYDIIWVQGDRCYSALGKSVIKESSFRYLTYNIAIEASKFGAKVILMGAADWHSSPKELNEIMCGQKETSKHLVATKQSLPYTLSPERCYRPVLTRKPTAVSTLF